MSEIDEKIQKLLTLHLGNIKVGISQRMTALGRNASGSSVASLDVNVSGNNGILFGGKQWETMQHGRGPGKVPSNFREVIKNWVRAKGINIKPKGKQTQEQAIESFSYLVTRNIMQKGTKLYRYKGYNDIYDTLLKEEIEKLSDDISTVFELEVNSINDKYINDDNKID
nr:MAG TPA: hypothetical protein [Caudoviricetes sp.]